jgi:hypothetical protein
MEIDSPVSKQRTYSWLWVHFTKVEGEKSGKCVHCGEIISRVNGTNQMKSHITSKHKDIVRPMEQPESKKVKTSVSDPNLMNTLLCAIFQITFYFTFCF